MVSCYRRINYHTGQCNIGILKKFIYPKFKEPIIINSLISICCVDLFFMVLYVYLKI